MADSRKGLTEAEVLAALRRGEVSFSPFSLALRPEEKWDLPDRRLDAVVELGWNARSRLFAVVCKRVATPAVVQSAMSEVRRLSRPPLLWPMLLFPYLPEGRLQELEREGISGLDLCGNGVVTVPGEWLVYRTGKPNLYRQSFPIKNVFRGTSSLVSRVFLLRRTYNTVGEVREEVKKRGGQVTLSTVSKVLARLEEELIVGRESGAICLFQPDKLLQRLVENYRPPRIRRRFVGKCGLSPQALLGGQLNWARENQVSIALTGVSSARLYAAMAYEETASVYCSDVGRLLARLGNKVQEQTRFPDLELLETDDDIAYFDRRENVCPWASPLQTYLELATGGKREQETAEQVKRVILSQLMQVGQEQRP
jgi:hypothetical protein